MAKLLRAIAATTIFALLHFCLGCGAGLVPVNTTPSIRQVVPQTIAAGSKNLTIKVSGSNFTSESVILWNGSALSTSVIDSNTLSSTLTSNIVATPSTVQLQVQDTVTKASSTSVPVVITTPANGASASPLILSTTSLPQPTLGAPYSAVVTANGGTPSYTWTLTEGQLPSGFTLSATGVISGVPVSSGNFSFTITVTDSSSPAQTAAMQFALNIPVPPPVTTPPPPVIPPVNPTSLQITSSLPAGAVGSMYSGSLQVTGGTAPYTWSSSSLPAGLSLGSDGTISGDPTSSGSTTVTFTVADSSSPVLTASVPATLVVAPSPLTITIVSLPAGQTSSPYSASLQVHGGTAPYTWSASALPAGLALANNGTISGTPIVSGNFPITVTVTDAGSPTLTTKASFTLSVVAEIQPLIITSTSLAPATTSKPYSASFDASGGTAPYIWSTSALPAGLTLASNGIISGTPTATGNFPITVTLADAGSPSQTTKASFTLSVTAAIQPLTVTSAALAGATSNQAYSASLNAAGGTAPYTWSASALPAGLIFASDGILSGTPTVTGSFPVTFTVTDAGSPTLTAKATLTLSVTADIQPLTITSTAVASATSSKQYSASLDASGGTAPYTWTSTALPAGLSLRSNGIISGTPTTTGSFPITFTVTDAGSPALTAKTTLSISITAAIQPLTITSTAFAGATANQPYTASLNASGGTAPYIWSATGLPAGLSLASNGIIAGTPTATGNFPITVNVTDSGAPAATAKATFSLSVTVPIQPLTITSTAFTGATANQPYATSLNASGGTAPYTWSAAGLPAGLSLASNGIIAGTPSTAGSFPITVTVTDAGSPSLTAKTTLTLSVAAAIQPLTITSIAFVSATANQPYSVSLNASGGTAPYTWSAAGLPAGLSLSSNGIISGTPTATGNFSITVTVTDSQSPTKAASATIPLSITAPIAPLSITSTTFAGATSTQPYTTTLSATGGTAPYTWSVTGLPAGLSLGGNGVIVGTPTTTGTFPISVTVTDSQSPAKTASANISLSVTAAIAPLTITSNTFAGATSTQPYTTTLSATGGTAPYTWSVTGLPAGLNLGSNGVIAGTPTTTGTFPISVTVTDSQSPAKTASANISLAVTAAIAPLSITSTTFAGATSTQPYTTTLSATGGTAPYTWSVTGLPAGLNLGSNGVIAGTPTTTGTFPISVTVTDSQSPAKTASANISLSVTAAIAPLTITSNTFAGATSTQPYTTTLSATGGTAPYTWSVTGLPAGLSLGGNGVIAGTPTTTGTFPISVTVTDSQSPAKTASANISLSVTAAIAPLTITSNTFAGATSTQPYTTTLSATGGTAPYTWSVTGLPAGLNLGSNGVIAGTPTTTGTFPISVTVTDSQSPAKTASANISLAVTAAIAPLSITSTTFAGATSTQPYTTTLSATGGTAPYTWSVTGLPAGLNLGSNGVIAGTPTTTGTFPISVTVTDSQSPAKTASANISLSVTAAIAPLTITSNTFAGATSTQPYTTTLSATGGTAPYTWSVTGLPAGLSLGGNGVIAGTPTTTGTFPISVTVTDSQSPAKTASANISLSVTAAIAPLTITSNTFAGATSTQPYTTTLSATGGTAPYTWSVTGLPAGLNLGSNGVIAGTPTTTGTFPISVTVTDSQSPAKTASANISLAVTAAIAPLSITSTTFAGATSTQPYTTTLSATGGTAPYTWSVTGLPAGLNLGSNGVIAGTPTTTGTFPISVTVTDSQSPAKTASANISLSVTAAIAPLTITSNTFAGATSTQPYTTTLSATGGTAPYTWSVTGLPAGLSLGGNGVIAGTPTTTGTFPISVTVTDSQSPAKTASANISLSVTAAIAPLTITSNTFAGATSTQPYTTTLSATGGTAPYTWSVTGLPAGLNLGSNGVIAGTPTTTGTFPISVTVTDSQSPAKTASANISLAVTAAIAPLSITSTTFAGATSTQPYTTTLSATGGTAPYTWSVTGLPAGLNLGSNGVIAGTPTTTGTFPISVTVTDSQSPAKTASANISLSVTAAIAPLTITSNTFAGATSTQPYTTTLSATGGTAPYTWSVTGLPAGLSLGGNGVIAGTPTTTGTFPISVTVTDSQSPAKTASANISLSVTAAIAPLTITSNTFAGATSTQPYTTTLSATGGTAPYTWSVTGLPAGLNLGSNGVIAGTPTTTGTFPISITVTDSQSPAKTASANISLAVTATPLTVTTSTLPSGTEGAAYSGTLQASGGTPAYTWSISYGSLPAGLTLAATTGVISGTPSVSGASSFTATVSDNGNPVQTKSVAVSITLSAAQPPPGPGTTWYIRADGGTNTQCTGKTNAAYPGSGSGQACAFNHPYQMLNSDGSWTAFKGGDTIQFADSGSSQTYYMGEQNQGIGTDWHSQLNQICPQPNANQSQGFECVLPVPPSGTASQHTRILGQNAGNCHDSGHTHLVNPTVLSGIDNAYWVLDVQGSNYVDVACIEVTQPDTCTTAGGTGAPGNCGNNTPNAVRFGGLVLQYQTAQGPSNFTLTDFAVVGVSGSGILGSHLNKSSSDVFTASDVYVIGNGQAGWNGDGGACDGSASNDCETVGTMNLSHVTIDWNGCMAVKPYDMTKPDTENKYNFCYGQVDGGYGDGFVQVAAGNMTLNVDHSFFRWNTQDGFDSLHLSDDVTTSPAIHISDSWSEGNGGQTFKLGAGAASSAVNNVSISNCRVLATASNFPLNPSGWALDSADTCRASGNEWAFQMDNGSTITLENNTSVGYGTTMYDLECAALAPNCVANGAKFIFKNNISKGYPDPGNGNRLASGIYLGAGNVFANSGSVIDHNLWSTMNTGCPDNSVTAGYETIYTCGDPALVSASNINAINPNITSSSAAINSGIAISGITTDFNGATRANPPAIGAMEP